MSQAPPTRRRWFQFGIGTVLAAVTAVAVLAACYAIFDRCRAGLGLLSAAEFEQRVSRADGLVHAIYDYKRRTGLWPKDSKIAGLEGVPDPGYHWHYQWLGENDAPMLIIYPVMHCDAKYRFPENSSLPLRISNEWQVSGEVPWKTVKFTAIPPSSDEIPDHGVVQSNR
jgi:hypothetical protein